MHTFSGSANFTKAALYDVREEIPERRRALAAWTDFLVTCETGSAPPPPGNVVPFRRVA